MAQYRARFGPTAYLIAKLERPAAVAEARPIAGIADELWLCRGDLGAEVGLPAMAAATAGFSRQVAALPIPALLAGQVLEHLTAQPTPTRSEVCHLYDALQAGYGGVVLSDETGHWPLSGGKLPGRGNVSLMAVQRPACGRFSANSIRSTTF
jgi:pyruvate kinase